VNPAPSVWQGEKPYALTPINSDYVTQSQSLYNTNWYAFAPRVGMVRQTRWRDSDLIIRGGFGFFYDPGYGTSMSAFGGAPYSNIRTTILPQFPLSAGVIAPPGLPATKPFGTVGTAELGLKPPAIMAWDIALDRMYGPDQALTIAYVGTRGSRLLRTTTEPAFSPDYNILRLVTNEASSSYEALQVQFRRRAARNLQAQVSYTYSHSIDTGSTDIGGADFANLYSGERASSNYDIRHNLNASASYLLPSPKSGAMAAALRNWWTQFMFVARTGSPFDVVGISGQSSGTGSGSAEGGLFALVRPNYTGADVWLNDPYAPGGRRLNPAAFEVPSSYTQGSLGRNAINGFGMLQLDFSLRRQIFVRERQSIGLSVMAFNILNQPSFANPSYNMGANMASANFGVSTRPQYLGNEGMGGSLLQTGGPRSLQFVIRYQF